MQSENRFDSDVVLKSLAALTLLVGKEIAGLSSRIAALERTSVLRGEELAVPEKQPVVLRDLPREQAKEEVRNVFASGGVLFMSEVADRLNLPDQLVVELCMELQQEGELQAHDDTL